MRIHELIGRLGLDGWEDALGAELSKGMRQKASIAFALVRPFEVLLADEPLDGLHPPSREILFELLAETKAAGAAIVVSTHRPDVIAAAGRCVAIRDGRLAYDGTPDPKVLAEIFEPHAELERPPPSPPLRSRLEARARGVHIPTRSATRSMSVRCLTMIDIELAGRSGGRYRRRPSGSGCGPNRSTRRSRAAF